MVLCNLLTTNPYPNVWSISGCKKMMLNACFLVKNSICKIIPHCLGRYDWPGIKSQYAFATACIWLEWEQEEPRERRPTSMASLRSVKEPGQARLLTPIFPTFRKQQAGEPFIFFAKIAMLLSFETTLRSLWHRCNESMITLIGKIDKRVWQETRKGKVLSYHTTWRQKTFLCTWRIAYHCLPVLLDKPIHLLTGIYSIGKQKT